MVEIKTDVIEKIDINDTLAEDEKTAINKLLEAEVKSEDVKTAFQTEAIKVDGTATKFGDIAKIFDDFVEEKNATLKIKDFNMDADKDGTNDAFDTNGDGTADLVPTWITRIITGKGNDLAYLITTLNKKLLDEATTVSETFDVSVKTELKNLKTEIEKTDASVDQKNTNAEIVATDIKCDFKNGITADQVVSAITTLQSKLKADNKQTLESGKSVGDIINLLKSGSREDVVKIQEALGMTPDATTLDKKADGLFGKRTLANLAAGGIVEDGGTASTGQKSIKETPVEDESDITFVNTDYDPADKTNESKITSRAIIDQIIDNTELATYHLTRSSTKNATTGRWTYTPMPGYDWIYPNNVDNLSTYKINETPKTPKKTIDKNRVKPTPTPKKQSPINTGKKEYDVFKNEIISLGDISDLPNEKRTTAIVYQIWKDNESYSFYNNGRVASTSRKGLSSWTDVIKRNKDNSGWERKSLSPETVDKNKVKKALEIAINTSMKEGEGPEITLSEDMWKSLNKKEQTNLKELREKATFQTMPTDKFGLESYAYTLFVNPQLESRIINEPNPRRDAAFLYRAMEGAGTKNEVLDRVFAKERLQKLPIYYLELVKQKFSQLYPTDEELITYMRNDLEGPFDGTRNVYPELVLASIQRDVAKYNRLLAQLS